MSAPAAANRLITTASSRLTTTAIVPTFNREPYIGACLESLLTQTRRPDQIIVVDDGSTDGTARVVRGFGDAITLLSKPNGGKSTALNIAMNLAAGDAIWIFDDDDVAVPDALETLAGALEARADAGFSYGLYSRFDGSTPYLVNEPHTNFFPITACPLNISLLEENFIMQPAMLARRACYEQVGPFDTTLIRSQDYDMLLRLSRRYAAVRVEKVVFHQRQHSGDRGSLAAPIRSASVGSVWASYDRAIFDQVYRTYDLREFATWSQEGGAAPPNWQPAALLRRGCIMARKGLWAFAAADLAAFADLASRSGRKSLSADEQATLRRMFYASDVAVDTVAGSADFRAALGKLEPRLERQVRAALLWPFPYLFRKSVTSRNASRLLATIKAFRALATPATAWSSLIQLTTDKLQATVRGQLHR